MNRPHECPYCGGDCYCESGVDGECIGCANKECIEHTDIPPTWDRDSESEEDNSGINPPINSEPDIDELPRR